MDPRRIEVSDYGFPAAMPVARRAGSGGVRFGFVGTMAWHKGAHVLLDAAKRLRGAFEVVVSGDAECRAGILRAASSATPPGCRCASPARSIAPTWRTIYGDLDVLVVPSLWPENSPLVIHEAFMHGVAVVGARVGGIPELVDEAMNGLHLRGVLAGCARGAAAAVRRRAGPRRAPGGRGAGGEVDWRRTRGNGSRATSALVAGRAAAGA